MSTSYLTPADRTALLHEVNAIRKCLGNRKGEPEARQEFAIYTTSEIQRLVCNLGVPQRIHGSPLLDLPMEIRVNIYYFGLPSPRDMRPGQKYFCKTRQNNSSLLRTCHQIFKEASDEIYGRRFFEVCVGAWEFPRRKDPPGPHAQLQLLGHGLDLFHPDWQHLVGSKASPRILPLRHLRKFQTTVSVEHTMSSCCNAQDLLFVFARHLREAGCCLKEVDVELKTSPRIFEDKQWNDEDQMHTICLEPFHTLLEDSNRDADIPDEPRELPQTRYRTHNELGDDMTEWQTLRPHSNAPTSDNASSGTMYFRYMQTYREHVVSPRSLWGPQLQKYPESRSATFAAVWTELSTARFKNDMDMFRRSHVDLIALIKDDASKYRHACRETGDQTSVDNRCRQWLEIEDVLCQILEGV